MEVDRGEVVGLLGPNGAGKTTTMRVMSGYLPPTSGEVRIGGYDVVSHSLEARRKIGYLPENAPLYPELRVLEYIEYRARLKGLRGSRRRRRVHEVLAMCGLEDDRMRIIGQLSKGYRQRVGLADSLVGEPELLILDEPSLGLDPNQRRDLRDLIRQLGEDHTVLLSSHLLTEVEAICSRTIIIHHGRVVASDTPRNIAGALMGHRVVNAEIRGPREQITAAVESLDHVMESRVVGEEDGWLHISVKCSKDVDVRSRVAGVIASNGWELRDLRAEVDGFEDAFIEMIRDLNRA
jgi:ABC-2 type transport system ATP-binding protein